MDQENKSGYKKTKIERIPENWSINKLGDCFKLASGNTKPNNLSLNKTNKNKYAIYGGNGILGYSDQFFEDGEKIIIGRVGEYCGTTRYVREKCWITDNALYTSEFYGNNSIKFFSYLLEHENLSRLRNKGGQPLISQRPIYVKRVIIPTYEEQHKIAQILTTWDNAIEITQKLITAKEQQKKALMQQLLNGHKRFGEYNSNNWCEVKLGDVFNERNETNFPDLKLLAITSSNGIVDRDSVEKRDTSNQDKSKYKKICVGDIGYNTMRLWQGVAGLSKIGGIVSPAYTVVIPTEKIDGLFVSYLFKLPEVIHLFYRHSQGLVNDTLNCKYHHFSQVKVTIPKSKQEQQKIASVLQTADMEIRLLKKKLKKLQQQKKGLMQVLLTGKIRVKIDEDKN